MMNVLHIVLGLQVGGLEKLVLDLINNYPPSIHAFIACLEKKGELGQRHSHLDIFELNKAPYSRLNTIRQLVSLARELNIDIIHTHNPSPHLYGAITGLITQIPVIHTKHGRNSPTDKKKVWINRISSFLTKKIVAVSQNAAEVCLKVEKISSHKIMVILNGADTTIFYPQINYDVQIRKIVHIGTVARLSSEKDHQTLLKTCRLLANQTTKFHLNIIGDGPLLMTLKETVKDLDIDSFVSFKGMRHDVPKQLRNLDIFVLSSITEGISLTLLEAMATGLPVVATNVGGNPEVVIDGETGFIVPPKNAQEMANKLSLLITDENIRRQMGRKGRRRVENHFSINETVRQYQEIYYSLVRN